MNIFSEKSSSKYTYSELTSRQKTPSKDLNGYISLSKELNIPIISVVNRTAQNQRKNIKLFDSPHLNDNTFTTLSINQSKNEVDILSKLMNWEKIQVNQQQLTFKQYHDLKPKTEYLRNQNPKSGGMNQEEYLKQLRQLQTQKQVPKSQIIHKKVQLEVEIDDQKLDEMENLGPQNAKTNQKELNQYIISGVKTTNRILPKLQQSEKNEKNNLMPNQNRQKRFYSVLDTLLDTKFEDNNDSMEDDIGQKQFFRKRKSYFKRFLLRKRIIVILAVLRISKKYRTILNERAKYTQNLDQQRNVHQKFIDQFRTKNLQYHKKDFAEGIFQKLNSIILDKKYIKECEEIQKFQDFIQKDIKKQRFCQFVSLLLQSLEIATKQNVLPALILLGIQYILLIKQLRSFSIFLIHQLNLNFFKSNNTQSCLFVLNRACYYSLLIPKITKDQQLIIASEYLIFSLIIPNIFEIFNEMKIKSLEHNNQTLSYLTALTQIVQELFVEYFKDLEKVNNKNIKPIQRILQLDIDDNTGIAKSEVIISSKINSDETIIIENGFDKSSIRELQTSKPYWNEKMKSRFTKIISNIEKLIVIKNI